MKEKIASIMNEVLPGPETMDEYEYSSLEDLSQSIIAQTEQMLGVVTSAESAVQRMENLSFAVDLVGVPSLESRVLIEEGFNSVLEGSTAKVEELLPDLHEEGKKVSTESIRSTIGNAVKRIIEIVKNILNRMVEFWDSLISMSGWIRFTATNAANRAKTSKGAKVVSTTLKFTGDPNRLFINGAVYRNTSALIANVNELRRQLEVLTGPYSNMLKDVGENLKRAYNHTDAPSAGYLQGCITAVEPVNFVTIGGLLKAHNQRDVRFEGGSILAAPPLLGNRTLFLPKVEPKDFTASLLNQAQSVRSLSMTVLHTNETQVKIGEVLVVPTMTPLEVEGLMREVIRIADLVATYDKTKRKQSFKLAQEVVKAYESACAIFEKRELTFEDKANYNSAGRFASQFASWTKSPIDALCMHALMVCRTVISLSNRSMQNYR